MRVKGKGFGKGDETFLPNIYVEVGLTLKFCKTLILHRDNLSVALQGVLSLKERPSHTESTLFEIIVDVALSKVPIPPILSTFPQGQKFSHLKSITILDMVKRSLKVLFLFTWL